MRAYTELLVRTCHKRGAHAIGGMAAFIPSRRDPEVNEVAFAEGPRRQDPRGRRRLRRLLGRAPRPGAGLPRGLRRGPRRPAEPDRPAARGRAGHRRRAARRRRPRPARSPRPGLRNNVSVGIQYLDAWLRGSGAVAIFNLMEDAATAEISRSQIWQWLHNDVDARRTASRVTRELVERIIDSEMASIRERVGEDAFASGRWDDARALFTEIALADDVSPTSSPLPGVRADALTARWHARDAGPRVRRRGRSREATRPPVRPGPRPALAAVRCGPRGGPRARGDHRPAASCAPTSATGWPTTRSRPGWWCCRRRPTQVAAVVRACAERRRAVRGPRLRHRPVRRRAAPRRRRPHRHLADARRSWRSTATTSGPSSSPGVINLDVTRAAAPHGYYYAPDPSSQQICSIGGNVAENSGGAHCLKYGFTTNHVLGVELVTPDGDVVRLGGARARRPRLRPARRVRRLRGHPRHRHRGHRAADPCARGGAHAAGRLRLHRRGGRGDVGDHRGRDRAGGDRDDGRAGDRGGRGGRALRLPGRRRGGADRRAGRRRRSEVDARVRRGRAALPGARGVRDPGRRRPRPSGR